VTYLDETYPKLKIISQDFWGTILMKFWGSSSLSLGISYNISTQIVLEH
jgi:hypothetical protein